MTKTRFGMRNAHTSWTRGPATTSKVVLKCGRWLKAEELFESFFGEACFKVGSAIIAFPAVLLADSTRVRRSCAENDMLIDLARSVRHSHWCSKVITTPARADGRAKLVRNRFVSATFLHRHDPSGLWTLCCFIVVLHLSPAYESRLAGVLQERTSMPVIRGITGCRNAMAGKSPTPGSPHCDLGLNFDLDESP
jgi:hypothetical protein